MDTITNPYFVDKAAAVFTRAGGDPANSGPLAAWAASVRESGDSRLGVIVAEDGTLLAVTRYYPGRTGADAGAAYVVEALTGSAAELVDREAGLAAAAASRLTGQNTIRVTFSDVCTGPGRKP